uniref:Uncharacterized protein n=1 Tax=Aegilops tauschii subsp. strangulata TaxID=200361 RepID=A0A453KQM4_AEGTS
QSGSGHGERLTDRRDSRAWRAGGFASRCVWSLAGSRFSSRSREHRFSFDFAEIFDLIGAIPELRKEQGIFLGAMAMGLGRFTHWLWPGNAARVGNHELPGIALTGASFPEFPSGFREADAIAFSSAAAGRRTRPRRVKNQRRSRGEPRIDREYDMVIVPSDGGGCLSGSESDDSDWS